MTIEYVDVSPLPMLNLDLEVDGEYPPVVEAFRQKILQSDCFLFASPKYDYSITGKGRDRRCLCSGFTYSRSPDQEAKSISSPQNLRFLSGVQIIQSEVFAKTDVAARSKGITAFIVEKGTHVYFFCSCFKGRKLRIIACLPAKTKFSTAQKLDKLGMRGSVTFVGFLVD